MFIINNFFNDGTQAPDLANYVFTTRAIKQIKIKTHLLMKNKLCSNRIQIIFCMYVEISVNNIINILDLQILINMSLF